MKCALCDIKECYGGRDCTQIKESLQAELEKADNMKIMKAAAANEADGYLKLTRIEELINFCKSVGFRKLGIAFCIGLQDEARIVHTLLERDFEVYSVCCKVCGIDKGDLGLKKMKGEGFEASCDPIGQALVLNAKATDLNIIVGLCVGHDMLFTRYSEALVTTLVAKDRVLAHNPVGAIYSHYYRKKLEL